MAVIGHFHSFVNNCIDQICNMFYHKKIFLYDFVEGTYIHNKQNDYPYTERISA